MVLCITIPTKTQGEDPFNRHNKSCTLQIVTSMIQLDNFSYEQLIHKALHCNLYLKNRSQLHPAAHPRGCASPKTTFIAALVNPVRLRTKTTTKQRSSCVANQPQATHYIQQQITLCMKASSLHHCWFCSSFMNFLFSHFTHMFYFSLLCRLVAHFWSLIISHYFQ